jgi:hypothetical protein
MYIIKVLVIFSPDVLFVLATNYKYVHLYLIAFVFLAYVNTRPAILVIFNFLKHSLESHLMMT